MIFIASSFKFLLVHVLFIIGGTTFHAGLRFPFNVREYLPLESEQLHNLRKQFERMMVVIIDEMSLLAADFFYNVHRRMVEIFFSKEMFGDRGVMLVGDLLQIPPVCNQKYSKLYYCLRSYIQLATIFIIFVFL